MKYTYIIMDDEELIRKGTVKKLSSLSSQIECVGMAGDGIEGIRLVKELNPDLIILDMQMPKMGGMELLPYLAENYPTTQLLVISAYQEFEYIKQAMKSKAFSYILKPFSKNEILEAVLQIINILEARDLERVQQKEQIETAENAVYELDLQYIRDKLLDASVSDYSFSSKKLQYLNGSYSYTLFSIYLYAEENDSALKEKIQNEMLLPEDQHFLLISQHSMPRFLFLIVIKEEPLINDFTYTKTAQAILAKLFDAEKEYISISSPSDDLSQLHYCLEETRSILDTRSCSDKNLFMKHGSSLRYGSLFTWDNQDAFYFRIETGDTALVRQLLDELFLLFIQRSCSLLEVKTYCSKLTDYCRVLLYRYLNISDEHSSGGNMQGIVTSLYSIQEVKQYFTQFFMNVTSLLLPSNIYKDLSLSEKVKLYIDNHYQQDLSLDLLASLFYVNRSYLSYIFRLKTGTKFVDYVNDLRIQKAKELLRNSNLKLYQISKMIGYDNSKYFYRVFKNRTGLTPEQYRNSGTEENSGILLIR